MRTSVDVHNFLLERDIPHEVFPIRGRVRSPERLAAVLDLPADEVGKVVIFEGASGSVAAVVPAGLDPDISRLRGASGLDDLEPVTDPRAAALTGYLAEAMPPAGLPNGFQVFLDRAMARDAVLYFPAGESRAVLKIRGKDLARATGAKVRSIAPRPGSGR